MSPRHTVLRDRLKFRNLRLSALDLRTTDVDVGQARGVMDLRPGAGREGKQVCGNGLGFREDSLGNGTGARFSDGCRVTNAGPVCRSADVQREPGLEIGLVKARERHRSVHGDEERVEIFAVVFLVNVARDGRAGSVHARGEAEDYRVLPGLKLICRQH